MNKIEVKNVDLFYGDFQALKDVSILMPENKITAFIGPSGCGKSTMLKLSLIHISEPTRQAEISYAVFCLKKKKQKIKFIAVSYTNTT